MNTELLEALTILEKEKNISKDVMMEAIENSLLSACKNHFGTSDNIKIVMDRETCDYSVFAEKEVVEEVFDPAIEISLEDAEKINPSLHIGDIAQVPVYSKEFGRIATQNAKNLILQKIREEERKVVFDQYFEKEKDIVTGIVQRYVGKNISINLGRADAMLTENEQVKGEHFEPTERIKLYIVEVKNTTKGPKILVSRTHPELVKRLFEAEVAEVKDGTVEIKSIAREAGSRTKMAVPAEKQGMYHLLQHTWIFPIRIWYSLTQNSRQPLLLEICLTGITGMPVKCFRFRGCCSGVIFRNLLLIPGLHLPRLAGMFI